MFKDNRERANSGGENNKSGKSKRVVIVGGGFGGLNAARELARRTDLEITILDRRNYHLFQPLLYQVALAALNPGEIATPIRTVLSKYQNVHVVLSEVESVDLGSKVVTTNVGSFIYDYLILACGARQSYFGNEAWEPFAPGLKTLEQATEIRRRILLAFEKAEIESNPDELERLMTFVVVGGGPTGVELAGAIGEISRYFLERDFHHVPTKRAKVILLEAGPRILSTFSPKLSDRARRDLEQLGVQVVTDKRVTDIDTDGVRLGDEKIQCRTVVWAAGVQSSEINATLDVPLDKAGRVIVAQDLSIPGHSEVFVVGDQAAFIQDGKPLPGLAPVAMQAGRAAASMIMADLKGEPRSEFQYLDKGQMATIGVRKAVVETGPFKFAGRLAWYAWLLVHIYYLIDFRNRILVMLEWAWSYLTFRRGAQLIVNKEWRSFKTSDSQ